MTQLHNYITLLFCYLYFRVEEITKMHCPEGDCNPPNPSPATTSETKCSFGAPDHLFTEVFVFLTGPRTPNEDPVATLLQSITGGAPGQVCRM